MGKPRMIILIRHAQSEGNKNRDIHQFIPDHRVKLTSKGWEQAEDAGRQLRDLLKPDDTVQFFTSPYRRTRETTEGILRTLTADDPTPSPFPRHTIKVYEEPRLREQDFGNFQPCSAEMERMWQERADYGHFFYRIPNGESAADAYDRVAGFNESLWRQFSEEDFPSVCVLVTHGLMTRVFLMKWYHWSVEYFEDLRNVNHCEFIIMKQNEDNKKYILQNELRTWSDLKKRAAANGTPRQASDAPLRRWGGCANGCNHAQISFPRRARRQNTQDFSLPSGNPGASTAAQPKNEHDDHPISAQEADASDNLTKKMLSVSGTTASNGLPTPTSTFSEDADNDNSSSDEANNHKQRTPLKSKQITSLHLPLHPGSLHPSRGRDGGGSQSGAATPAEGMSDDSDFGFIRRRASTKTHRTRQPSRPRVRSRSRTFEEWQTLERESGMGRGVHADRLGDDGFRTRDGSTDRDVLSGVEEGSGSDMQSPGIVEGVVEGMKRVDRKGFGEIY